MKHLKSLGSMFLIMLLLVACGANTPTDFLTLASSNSKDLKSYAFESKAVLSVKDVGDNSLDPQQAFTALDGMNFTVKGAYDAEKERMEAIITFSISGDFKLSIDIPIITDKQAIYIKIPNIAPLFELPDQFIDKYIIVNLDELSNDYSLNLATSNELSEALFNDIIKIIIEQYGNSEFLSLLAKEDLPKDKEVIQALQFKVTDANLNPFLQKFIGETLPQTLEVIKGNEQYLQAYELTASDIDTLIAELASSTMPEDVKNEMSDLITINEITYTTGLNKSNFINYQSFVIDVITKNEGYRDEHIIFTLDSHLTNINKEQTFALEIPSPTNVISIEDLISSPEFLSYFYGYDDLGYFEDDFNYDDSEFDWDLGFSGVDFFSGYDYVDVTPNKLDFNSTYDDGTFIDEFGNWISKEEYLKLYGDRQLMYDEEYDVYYDDFWNALVPQ